MSRKQIKENGITLVTLVVTVIVMLILAGVTFNLLIGDNGILKRTRESKEIYEKQAAKEKLELAMGDLGLRKYKDSNYNEKEYIDTILANQNIIMIEDIAVVDDWLFEIDRSVPKIVNDLGRGKENKDIKIQIVPTISQDYVKATLQIEITYEGELSEIKLKAENIEIPIPVTGVYTIEKEVLENGNYTIIVKDKEGNYKIENVLIAEITEDMEIWNKEDMEQFRDKVKEGRTFKTRTVQVMQDIDLGGTENNQWIPIGDEINNFEGTFVGNYHTISNLYINNSNRFQGLFGDISNATLKQIVLDNVNIKAETYVAGVVGRGKNIKMEECGIENTNNSSRIQASDNAGGIAGNIQNSSVKKCYNKAEIAVITSEYVTFAGGIVGMSNGSHISYCYNTNNVSIVTNKFDIDTLGTRAGGITGKARLNSTVEYCYNLGRISATGKVLEPAGICSANGAEIRSCFSVGGIVCVPAASNPANRPGNITAFTANSTVRDCYCIQEATIGFNYTGNTITNNKLVTEANIKSQAIQIMGGDTDIWLQEGEDNNGYPILKWEQNK